MIFVNVHLNFLDKIFIYESKGQGIGRRLGLYLSCPKRTVDD